ncbi:pentapeptide repeat-containing protein [Curtobacterium sp. NPDC088465]|uniref:pentapeptide repeat-containing protein n=1 Tax=Curtobacterium sp. NPDC088465 TaxID=3363967 RepID=UPI00380C4FF5
MTDVQRTRRRSRPRTLAVVGMVVLLAAAGAVVLDRTSADPATETIGGCAVVDAPSVDHRTHCPRVDLAGADLRQRDLRLADLRGADLSGADLTGTILYGADLTGADLRGTDLTQTDLTGASITDARLGDTRFTDAVISSMRISGTPLAAVAGSATTDGQDPVLLRWTSGTQPGIVDNTCVDREGLFYPGTTPVTCYVKTGPSPEQTLEYTIEMSVDQGEG